MSLRWISATIITALMFTTAAILKVSSVRGFQELHSLKGNTLFFISNKEMCDVFIHRFDKVIKQRQKAKIVMRCWTLGQMWVQGLICQRFSGVLDVKHRLHVTGASCLFVCLRVWQLQGFPQEVHFLLFQHCRVSIWIITTQPYIWCNPSVTAELSLTDPEAPRHHDQSSYCVDTVVIVFTSSTFASNFLRKP